MEAPQGVELTGTNGGKAITQHAMLFLVLPVLRPSACSPGREHPFGPRNEFASIVRFPNRHMPPSPRRGGDRLKICGDHSQGETPGPIPNPEAKALHGDGTAPERVWESSTSPLTLLDRIPVEPLRGFPGSFSYIRGIPVPGFLSFSSGALVSLFLRFFFRPRMRASRMVRQRGCR